MNYTKYTALKVRSEDGIEEKKQMTKEIEEQKETIDKLTKYVARLEFKHEDKSAKVIQLDDKIEVKQQEIVDGHQ